MATIKNSAADLAGKTLLKAEDSQPVTGLKTFLRAPLAPFGVEASSAVVPNLDADLLDGEHGADYHDAALLVGTVPATCLPDPLPARSAENLVNIPAANLTGPVPAASLPALSPVFQTVASTGTVDDLALNDETTDLLCTNASALVLTGLAGGSPGRRIWVHAAGAGSVKVAHEGVGSAEANRAIGVSTAGQILGTGGLLLLVYDNTASRWRIYLVDHGAPITPQFAAGNFSANGSMTWTVEGADVSTCTYQQRGKRVFIDIAVSTTSVGGTPDTMLQIGNGAWGGFTAAKLTSLFLAYYDGNTTTYFGTGEAHAITGGTQLQLYKTARANWSASTNQTYIRIQGEIEVQ